MQRRIVTKVFCVLCLIALQSWPSVWAEENDAEAAKQHVKTGESAAEKSDWDAAVTEFEAATKMVQTDAIAYYDLGIAHFHLGNLEKAAEAEKRAISLDSKLIDAYVQLAAILSKAEDYSGAERILEKAIKVNPSCEPAKDSLNELCKLKRQYPDLFKKKKTSGLSDADVGESQGSASNSASPSMNVSKSENSTYENQTDATSSTEKSEQPKIAPDLLERPRSNGREGPVIDSTKVRQSS